jgi:hypothetical protein
MVEVVFVNGFGRPFLQELQDFFYRPWDAALIRFLDPLN